MIDEYKLSSNWNTFEQYRTKSVRGLLTGYREIDRKIIGLPGFVTVQGEPKSYKSTFALNIALNNAKKGNPVLWVDRENGLQRTRLRMICNLAQVTSGAIKSNKMTDEEDERYCEAVEELNELPFYYLDTINSEEMEEILEAIGKRHRRPVLLVVDSLQSLVSDFKDRRASVDYWVFWFNDLKKKYETKLTVLVISEKNRSSYGMASKSGAKESGGIEYKSEMVLDLYRRGNDPEVKIECTYNRDGDTGYLSSLIIPNNYYYNFTIGEECPE